VIFKLNKDGTIATRSLSSSTGQNPYAALVRDGAGNMYGTAYQGGAAQLGTVFKLDSQARFTTLYAFSDSNNDGQSPSSGVVMDASGNLYGTTRWAGYYGYGIIYKITP
jgi:uncharacterized repeat protein (TIGR03803 family)